MPRYSERQLDVLVHRQVADQVEALEHESDGATSHLGPLALRQPGGFLTRQLVRARGRLIEQAHQVQQRGLATARRPHDGNELAAPDGQRDAVEGRRLHLIGGVDLA